VYHYTSTEGFQNIVRSRSLWATHLKYLNDPSEHEVGLACLSEVIREKAASTRSLALRQRMRRMLGRLIAPDIGVYAASFTTLSDDLNHWRTYAADRGVAIGFPRARLESFVVEHGIVFLPCEYRADRQRAWMRSLVERCIEDATGRSPAQKDYALQEDLLWRLPFWTSFLKNRSYASEAEWRMVVSLEDPAERKLEERFRLRRGALVPYVELPLPDAKDAAFWSRVRVRLSPTLGSPLQETAVARFLEAELGVAGKVTSSVIPLRDAVA
jgi:hypothetical protein